MKKKSNAVAAIFVVVTLIVGTTVMLFNPFRQEDKMINYAEQISFLENLWLREYYNLQNEFFHSRDDSYWYYNFSAYPPMDTTLDTIIDKHFVINFSYEFNLVNVTYNTSTFIPPDLNNVRDLEAFIFTRRNTNITFENLFERRIINRTSRYNAGEIFDLYKGLYLWLEDDAANLSLNLRNMMEEECRFGYCDCNVLNENQKDYHKKYIISTYGINDSLLINEINNSINELNSNFIVEGIQRFNCSINYLNISTDNNVEFFFNESHTCSLNNNNIELLGSQGEFFEKQSPEIAPRFTPPPTIYTNDTPISTHWNTSIQKSEFNFVDDNLIDESANETRNQTFAYHFSLHKSIEAEFSILCEPTSSRLGRSLEIGFYFNLQRHCTNNTNLTSNQSAQCDVKEEDEEDDEDEPIPPPPGPPGNGGNGGHLNCDVCQKVGYDYLEDEYICVTVSIDEQVKCGSDNCKELMCDGTGGGSAACTIPKNIEPNNYCDPNDLNKELDYNKYCAYCGNEGNCDAFASTDDICETGFCANKYCSGEDLGIDACNVKVPNQHNIEEPCENWKYGGDEPQYREYCKICGDNGLCESAAPENQLCDENNFCHNLLCNGTKGPNACNKIQVDEANVGIPCNPGDDEEGGIDFKEYCAVCSDEGICDKAADEGVICEEGFCANKTCSGEDLGIDACNVKVPNQKNIDKPCENWKYGGDEPQYREYCKICGDDGLCNTAAQQGETCRIGGDNACSDMICDGGKGIEACSEYELIDGMENEPCKEWNDAGDSMSHRETCKICGDIGNCNEFAPDTQTCGPDKHCYTPKCSGDSFNCDHREARNDGLDCEDDETQGTLTNCAHCDNGSCVPKDEGTFCDSDTCKNLTCDGSINGCNIDIHINENEICAIGNTDNCLDSLCKSGVCLAIEPNPDNCETPDSNPNCTAECNNLGNCVWNVGEACDYHEFCDNNPLPGTCQNNGACDTNYKCCFSEEHQWYQWKCHKDKLCCEWDIRRNPICPLPNEQEKCPKPDQ